jgi:hypothetical protein
MTEREREKEHEELIKAVTALSKKSAANLNGAAAKDGDVYFMISTSGKIPDLVEYLRETYAGMQHRLAALVGRPLPPGEGKN